MGCFKGVLLNWKVENQHPIDCEIFDDFLLSFFYWHKVGAFKTTYTTRNYSIMSLYKNINFMFFIFKSFKNINISEI
jgi:hypothetical protein